MAKLKSKATLTIHGPGRMSVEERRRIAAWLRRHAHDLVKLGPSLTDSRFTGRYMNHPTRRAR